ncbi:MAG: hypothetical protein ABEJ93_01275 [Candidatus Nanohalobium sp.]
MPECDICGEEFDTERGLNIHKSQKHKDEEETEETEDTEEETQETEEKDTSEDAVVREIEEETSGGFLGGFSRESLVIGGILIGVAAGLALGLFLSDSGFKAGEAQVASQIEGLPGAQLNVTSVQLSHGVYEVNATREVQFGNQSISRSMQLHVSPDGEMLFIQGTTFEQLRQQMSQQQQTQPQQPPTQEPTGNESTANTTQ